MAKCVKRGDKVTVCHVANGNLGHAIIEPDELRATRIEEAKNAGKLAGIEVVTCDIGDLLVYGEQKEQIDKVVDVIRTAQPDFIITHDPEDYMPDHVAVSKLTFAAAFAASVPHYKTKVDKVAAVTNEEVLAAIETLKKAGVTVSVNPYQTMPMNDEYSQLSMLLGNNSSNNNSMMNMLPYFMGQNGNQKIDPQMLQSVMMNSMITDFTFTDKDKKY